MEVAIPLIPNPLDAQKRPVRLSGELTGLTGLRGIAAFTVFVAHSRFEELVPVLRPICRFFEWHALAVDLFFMLSGFVLVHVYADKLGTARKGSWRSYLAARFARIVPLYLITLLAALCVFLIGSFILKKWPAYITWETVITNVFLIQNWPGFFHISINLPSWSLSVEFLCYLVLMPVALILDKQVTRLGVALLLIALLLAGRAVVEDSIMGWASLARGLTCFLAGTLLHRFYGSTSGRALGTITVTGAAAFLVMRSLAAWAGLSSIWPLFSFPLLVLGLASPVNTLVHRFFQCPIMLWLGDISYSAYLWQGPVGMIIHYQIRPRLNALPPAAHAIWMVCEIVLILFLSTVSYRRLEIPLRHWIRARLDPCAA